MSNSDIVSCLTELTREYAVPGAQLAVRRAGDTWTCAVGQQQHGHGPPMTPDTRVPLGSISKVFTAAAVLALAADDDLDLDTPVAEEIPGLVRRGDGRHGHQLGRITARHLLSHTAGLPSDADDMRSTSLRRHVLDACRSARLLAAPGAAFSYSNLGYQLAGHLVEAVTGMSWWEAVRAIVLAPLGITPHFVVGERPPTPLATGHSVHPARRAVRPVRQSLTEVEAPAGGLAGSATELAVLGRALAGVEPADLLDAEWLELMRTPVPGAEPFGLADGWGLGLAGYGGWIGHDGNGDGTSCHLRACPRTGTVVALTANGSTGFALWRALVPALAALGLPVGDHDMLPDLGESMPPTADHLGEFANGSTRYTVSRGDGQHLRLTVDAEPFADLSLRAGHRFAMRDCDTGVVDQAGRFVVDGDGRIRWLQVAGRLARRTGRIQAVA